MLLLKPFTEDPGRSMVHLADPTHVTFIAHPRFATLLLAYVLDSLVRVSDGRVEAICASILRTLIQRSPASETHELRYQWIIHSHAPAQRAGRYARSLCLYPQQGFSRPSSRKNQAMSSPPPGIDADQPQASKAPEGTLEYLRYDMLQPLILLTISGPFSLSFQSAFHLSFTVLVRYRSLANI